MQDLNRTSTLGTAYVPSDIQAQIVKPVVLERWIFDRLDPSGRYLADLTPFVDYSRVPEITHDTTAAVRRTLRLRLRGDVALNPLQDMIQPHYQLKMPDGGYVDFALGTFLLLFPERVIGPGYTIWNVDGTDVSQLLIDADFTTSFGVAAGTSYRQGIASVLAAYGGPWTFPQLIQDSGKTLPAPLSWVVGDTRLKAINDLLAAVAFRPLWIDELGRANSSPLSDIEPAYPPQASYVFDTTKGTSMVKIPITDTPDITKAYNQVLVIGEDPRANPITAFYQNTLPNSPVSIPNWRPKLLLIRDSRIADQASAQARAQAEGRKAARVYSKVRVVTPPWAFSQDRDIYEVIYKTSDESLHKDFFTEISWQHRCQAGADTVHEFERVVPAS